MNLDLGNIKTRLIEEYTELQRLDSIATQGASTVELDQAKVGRLSRMDALQQQAMQVEQNRRRQQRMRDIKSALSRIQRDEFGFCDACGDEIPDERLQINPTVRFCTPCAKQSEST